MAERRQAARREPIEVELADGRVFTAQALPWMVANDLGNDILQQNIEALNNSVSLYVTDEGTPQLEAALARKITDWKSVLDRAYPDEKDDWSNITSDEAADLILASLEVNHMDYLNHLVDPNAPAPTNLGGSETSPEEMMTGLGQKIESTPDSSSEGSPETTSSL